MKTAKEYLEETEVWKKIPNNNLTKMVLIELAQDYADYVVKNLQQPAVMQQSEQLPCEHINLVAGHHPDQPYYCADYGYEP